jgi:glycosyltransferase involved in cell wall biosynthesis
VRGTTDDGDTGRRPRILLSAYAVDPNAGSEEMVGWQRTIQAARYCDVWVLCEPDISRAGIEGYIEENGPIPGLEVVYVPKTSLIRALERVPGLFYLAYNLWHRRAYGRAVGLHDDIDFDIAHQVNYCGYREPSYLWRLDTKFVWGPVGGTQNFPIRLVRAAGVAGGLREVVRSALNTITLRFSRRVRLAARNAHALWAANHTVANDLQRALRHSEIPVMLEIGASAVADPAPRSQLSGPLRILWAGEFRAFKALPVLLDALSMLPKHVDFELIVLGDGPERHRWQGHAKKLGLDSCIRWPGWVPHREMVDYYRTADLFAFTSLRDTSGSVVLEALAMGVPVVAPDHQGAGYMVTPDCGILVPVASYGSMVHGYRDAIVTLATDRGMLHRLGRGALERGTYYSWIRQGERMRDGYVAVLGTDGEDSGRSFDVSPRF